MALAFCDFKTLGAAHRAETARILRDALAHLPSAYGAPDEAEMEVDRRCDAEDWLGFAALEGDHLLGWIGALMTYAAGWEIHPLVVAPGQQRRGVGSALLTHLEDHGRRAGVRTLFLGSDDDYGGTTVFGQPLFPDVLGHAATVEATPRGHALTFYRKHGYRVVGLLPDVNGPGRPDILMARSLVSADQDPSRGPSPSYIQPIFSRKNV
jgi:aminoglycoside 6'-N-acetyltransferase I